jgi:hypothetical protein
VAEIVAVCVDATAEVEAAKFADEAPAGMAIDTGAPTAALLLERLTTVPLEGAAPDNVTVQVLEAPPVTLMGAH